MPWGASVLLKKKKKICIFFLAYRSGWRKLGALGSGDQLGFHQRQPTGDQEVNAEICSFVDSCWTVEQTVKLLMVRDVMTLGYCWGHKLCSWECEGQSRHGSQDNLDLIMWPDRYILWGVFHVWSFDIDGLVQERRNSGALTTGLRLSCINTSICFCK